MPDTTADAPGMNRRQLLKLGLFGTAVLTTVGGIASLGGCSADTPAQGFQQLRKDDLPMLRRVIPVVLVGALPAEQQAAIVEGVLLALDNNLNQLSPSLNTQLLQLFDLLTLGVTRGAVTGIWGSWENANDEAVQAFLKRWENSSFALLQQGQNALTNLILLSCYSTPASWPQCGYPGPPRI
ncbi:MULTISPECIES: hypothetical protein [Pseudomonadaceae]|jgi:hypothetical protein|uniref:Twin-arginine translocation pathway signal protein n=1 Tax=Halopseudomonas bauzanensis TaxID=653930 RepID=A0A4U0YMM8_9GAMM|nr:MULTISPECIES: hypothetical protein [Pseudomonadaceae]EZQ18939.1 twin-arginine translocation pathway signal protein [Halopseudomonas bauzanensis]MBA1265356.1 twin-arginine translocation pathway signal protein [Stutzerimonas stutzeri]TKA93550.1 twin-arginine translocation pathway signal protein [Halopseudomonas bauzanensis]